MRRYLVTASIWALILAAPAAAQAPWSAAGELTDADSQGADARRYDAHPLRLEAGRRYRISVASDAFDPLAELYRAGQADPVDTDDDSGPGLNASIVYTPSESGDYVLRVTAFSPDGRGAYDAALALVPPPAAPMRGAESGTGRLEDGDEADDEDEGKRHDQYAIRLEGGRRYRIGVESTDFDPVARLYRPGQDEPVAENDDSGGGLNSRISFIPPESGDYVLRVTSFAAGGRGAYAYGVALQAPLPPPVTAPGTSVSANGSWSLWRGVLAQSDPDVDGRHFDDYLIRVEAGQRRYISLEGDGFDALVQVLRPDTRESDSPGMVDQDDDAGAGLNAFLVFAPEQGGDYIVRVTSVGSGTGAYRLWVSD